ncbi:PQ loop repeat-domain-containing protein [Cunninghamella echinulata]|nr:PQ loop repeat-domain-containing protein [Cunninghamella echinulata]
MYFVTIDICLLTQYLYYTKWKKHPKSKKRTHQHHDRESLPSNILSAFQHPSVQTPLLIQTHSIEDELGPYSTSSSPAKWYTLNAQHYDDAILKVPTNQSASSYSSTNSSSSLSSPKTKAFLAIMFFGLNLTRSSSFVTNNDNLITSFSSSSTNTMSEMDSVMIGRIFAWICTCLYLMSRIPQIRKNIKRQSVEGLAPSLFVFAALGNLTYSASILLHPGQTRESLMEAIPYLIGSAGTLTFDAAIFIQFLWYSRKKAHHHHQQIV